jgi:hypothetical protein
MDVEKAKRVIPSKRGLIIKIVTGLLFIALAVVCVFQFIELQNLRDPDYAAEQAKSDAAVLKAEVAKLMQLPDEEPTIATVQDISKLANQEFFKDAQDGDKVLIFTVAKKAIIYRESEHKIINSGPIIINSTQPATETTPDSSPAGEG